MYPFHTLLKLHVDGDTLIVRPCAEGIGFRYADLQSELNRTLRLFDDPQASVNVTNVVIDLCELKYYGTEFLGAVIALLNRVAQRGGRAVWCNASGHLQEVLEEMGVYELWPYYPSCDQALTIVRT
jgi:anti-anti-sigma regulatory factor